MVGDPVHVACCFDRAYVLPTAVMATSLLAHSSPERRYILHLVYDGADDAPLRVFKGFRRTALEVRLVNARNAFAGIPTAYPGMPSVSFLRLALGDLLPDVGRVLSLDPDTLCLDDVAEVFDVPLGRSPLAAVPDLSLAAKLAMEESHGLAAASGSNTMYLERQLKLDRTARSAYFNAGVMLLDLERSRADALPARALTFLQQNGNPLRWSEQCVLNAFYAPVYRQLPARWNVMLHPGRLQEYGPGGIALLQRAIQARAQPSILHFNWTAKPWIGAAN
jgi:lipopolysaccharide biosynthesis glycosyltransferase